MRNRGKLAEGKGGREGRREGEGWRKREREGDRDRIRRGNKKWWMMMPSCWPQTNMDRIVQAPSHIHIHTYTYTHTRTQTHTSHHMSYIVVVFSINRT